MQSKDSFSGAQYVEALRALDHDLAKYLCLPLGFMPADSTLGQFRDGVSDALLRTRTLGGQGVGAEKIWKDWQERCEPAVALRARSDGVWTGVERALCWVGKLDSIQLSDRPEVEADFKKLRRTLRELIDGAR